MKSCSIVITLSYKVNIARFFIACFESCKWQHKSKLVSQSVYVYLCLCKCYFMIRVLETNEFVYHLLQIIKISYCYFQTKNLITFTSYSEMRFVRGLMVWPHKCLGLIANFNYLFRYRYLVTYSEWRSQNNAHQFQRVLLKNVAYTIREYFAEHFLAECLFVGRYLYCLNNSLYKPVCY